MRASIRFAAALAALLCFPAFATAQNVDTADAAVYDDGWNNGGDANGGFGNWTQTFTDPGNFSVNGFFMASGNTDIGTGASNEAWALYANSGNTAGAFRDLPGALPVGGQLQIFMDNSGVNTGGVVGVGLQNAGGDNLMEFYFKGGDSNYYTNDGSGEVATAQGFTFDGLDLLWTVQAAGTYDLTINPLNGSADTVLTGLTMSANADQAVARVRVFCFDAGGGNDAFYNYLRYSTSGGLPVELDGFLVE